MTAVNKIGNELHKAFRKRHLGGTDNPAIADALLKFKKARGLAALEQMLTVGEANKT